MVGTPVPFTAAQRATPLSQNGPVRRLAAGMIANDEFFARGGELEGVGGWGGFKTKAQELVSNLAEM